MYRRYAIYHLPDDEGLRDFGAHWLGWDVQRGVSCSLFPLAGVSEVVEGPRRYGFHATLKPPFRLAQGCTEAGLREAVAALAGELEPQKCGGLELARLGRFFALTLKGESRGIDRIAAVCVEGLDPFRAPLTEVERAKRQPRNPQQAALLERWGYPHVMEGFRFHMTLSARLPKAALDGWEADLRAYLPELPSPFVMSSISLVGEREDGLFEQIERFALGT